MTYTETEHSHQSKSLKFLPEDYVPFQRTDEGERVYGVIVIADGEYGVDYQNELPVFGGYLARESFYGSPKYCANATRHHRKHLAEYGEMPHLVFFNSAEVAEELGFCRCSK
jgi:hypothetical protein